ncbi:MAG: hypothetical protein ACFFD4_02285 [Candidatus Odinarchaeota archaeon]
MRQKEEYGFVDRETRYPVDLSSTEEEIIESLRDKKFTNGEIEFIDKCLSYFTKKEILHALDFMMARKNSVSPKGRKSNVRGFVFRLENPILKKEKEMDRSDPGAVAEIVHGLFSERKYSRATKYRIVAELRKRGFATGKIRI